LPLVIPPAPKTWRRFIPFRVLQLVNRIRGRRPPPIARMAADPLECDCIVDAAFDYLDRLQQAQRQLLAQRGTPAPKPHLIGPRRRIA
jgi:hypothetical protein